MSEPKRYHLYAGLECHAFAKAEAVLKFSEEDDGIWVKYEDYARLKAEVERLTKAGDAMEILIVEELAYYEDDGSQYDEVKAWNAAKEGKPTSNE